MRTKWFSFAVALPAVCLAVFALYEGVRPLRKVSVHIGETMSQLLGTQEMSWFAPATATDYSTLVWPQDDSSGEVFDFTYDDPAGSIHLPQSRLIWVREYAAVVTSVQVSGSPEKGSIETFSKELDGVTAQFRKAGWQEKFPPPSLATLRSAIAGGNASMTETGVAQYVKNGTVAQLSLSSPGKPIVGGMLGGRAFVLDVDFTNPTLQDEQSNKVYDERLRVNGNVGVLLPLSHWMHEQR